MAAANATMPEHESSVHHGNDRTTEHSDCRDAGSRNVHGRGQFYAEATDAG